METIIVGIITASASIIAVVLTNSKTVSLLSYRIEMLEKKQDKHNNVIERLAILEKDSVTKWKRIDELKEDVERLKNEKYN